MAEISTERYGARDRRARKNGNEFHFILLVIFTFFLLTGMFEQLLPWRWRVRRGEGRPSSLLQQAWEQAETCTTYAFMG
jgi:hypothetical protein